MKLIHLSDLHIGKRLNEFSLIEDQKYILNQILQIIDKENPDGVLIAGDVYDKSTPSEEAVRILDHFLSALARKKKEVFIISGNHDSAVKLGFGAELMDLSGVHIAQEYNGEVNPFTLRKGEEEISIYLLPFIKPIMVRAVFPEAEINDYTDAVETAISHMDISKDSYNVLVAHQLVTGAVRSESEEISVGGIDNVDAKAFDVFDYVALGHLHGPQSVGRETLRYCGTPLKYSFSEEKQTKSVTIIEIEPKLKKQTIRTVELVPLYEMRSEKNSFAKMLDKKYYENTNVNDYLHIDLTDEDEILEAYAKLRVVYPNLMSVRYDNTRTRENKELKRVEDIEKKTPIELFGDFFEMQNNQKMSKEQAEFVQELINSIWEG